MAHVQGLIYQQRPLTSEGKEIKSKQEIIDLLQALHLPKEVSIIHCQEHQKGTSTVAPDDHMADRATQETALAPMVSLNALTPTSPKTRSVPTYTDSDIQRIKTCPTNHYEPQMDQWKTTEDKLILPKEQALKWLTQMHQWTHLGSRKLTKAVQRSAMFVPDLVTLPNEVIGTCQVCQMVNGCLGYCSTGKRFLGDWPGMFWEVDFIEIKPGKYLLVFVDTFSGWVEAFPTKKEIVAKNFLEEILPQFGVPKVLGSDNGPALMSQVSQGLATVLGADWDLHCAYHP